MTMIEYALSTISGICGGAAYVFALPRVRGFGRSRWGSRRLAALRTEDSSQSRSGSGLSDRTGGCFPRTEIEGLTSSTEFEAGERRLTIESAAATKAVATNDGKGQSMVEDGRDSFVVGRRGEGQLRWDADCEVHIHQVHERLWLASRASGNARCYLGHHSLGSSSLPITSKSSLLSVEMPDGCYTELSLHQFAAPSSGRRLVLVGAPASGATESGFFAVRESNGVIAAVAATAPLELGPRDVSRLSHIADYASELFVPTPAARFGTLALFRAVSETFDAGVQVSVLLAGLTCDGTLIFSSTEDVKWNWSLRGHRTTLKGDTNYRDAITIGDSIIPREARIEAAIPVSGRRELVSFMEEGAYRQSRV